MNDFTPGDRVCITGQPSAISGTWIGLTATVLLQPASTTPDGHTWIELDAGLTRPDGSSTQRFMWPTISLQRVPAVADLEARLEAALDEATKATLERDEARVELLDFKKRVVDVAVDYAEKFEMCTVVGRALAEMGLSSTRPVEYIFTGRAVVQVPIGLGPTVEASINDAIIGLDNDYNGQTLHLEMLSAEPLTD